MTESYKKKLIEVAIPLEAINAASAREKSIRHGHPSTLHLWWARRPLAACRAVLFAQLVDDPSAHPDKFPTHDDQEKERKRLFRIVEDLVKWENTTSEEVLGQAQAEIRRSCGDEMPPIYDPFSGGCSIPLEAQRLGLPAYGSDLNPVAVMIGKAMIEIPPKFKNMEPIHAGPKSRNHYRNAEGLAEDVKYYGEWMRKKAWERIGHLYPQVELSKEDGGGKANVIGWFWARTVPSPDPAFSGISVPIASSFLLSAKSGREIWLEPDIDRVAKTVNFSVRRCGTKAEIKKAKEGTKAGQATFRCIYSGAPIGGKYIDSCAEKGEMGSVLLAAAVEGRGRRIYLSSDEIGGMDYLQQAADLVQDLDLSAIEVPCRGTFASNALGRRYGFNTFRDYFTDRQLVALQTFSSLIAEVKHQIVNDAKAKGDPSSTEEKIEAYGDAISTYLSFAVDRAADAWSSVVSWRNTVEATRSTFARQGISMVWDFVEVNPFSEKNGNWNDACLKWVCKSLAAFAPYAEGRVDQADAQTVALPDGAVLSTDPPYYDNILYSDLSDFFYVWLRDAIGKIYPEVFRTIVVPKSEELVATVYRHGSHEAAEAFFLAGMTQAITNMSRQTSPSFPSTIYYAFKQSEVESDGTSSTGWATFLQAVFNAGFSVVATWPVRTEKPGRMIAVGTNALANSVVLVCRKKEPSAEVLTRAEFIRALKQELPSAISELQAVSIAPADMPQSAIGPGMGVFSRYKAVLEADDSPMTVKTALQLINAELDEYLGGIQGEFDADTRFAITWFEQYGMSRGDYGGADNLARARGISVDSVKHAGLVESAGGKVRLLARSEMDLEWEPGTDNHLTIWECLQHLVRLHQEHGIAYESALMLKKISDKAEAVKDLAYCLYDISANKRKDGKEATAYNALIADWADLSREAASVIEVSGSGQLGMDL